MLRWTQGNACCFIRYATGYNAIAFLLFALVFVSLEPVTHAQTITASITGTVTDGTGAVVNDASVTANNTETGLSFPTKTNRDGVYTINYLPVGSYTLHIAIPGFKRSDFEKFTLVGGQIARFDAVLKVGSANDAVVVTAEAPLLNTQNAELSTTMSERMIRELPLVADNIMGLALFTPGVVVATPSNLDSVSAANPLSSFNAAGNREQSNNFTLDGVDINNAVDNYLGYSVNRDALQEFRIITGNGNAEYGNANGGQVVMVTRSGTNTYHGSASAQLQNTLMNANSWVAKNVLPGTAVTPRASQNRNYYSGTFGGRLLRDRLFFFVDYRGVRQRVATVVNSSQPDPAYEGNPLNDMTGQAGLKGTGTAYDPNLNKAVPIINPAAKYLLSHPEIYPICNQSPCSTSVKSLSSNYVGYQGVKNVTDQGDVKLDWRVNEKNMISGRYSMARVNINYYDVPTPTTLPLDSSYPYTGFVVNWDHVFSSNVVNEARVGFSRSLFIQAATDVDGFWGNTGFSKLGIPYPTGTQIANGFPQMLMSGKGPGISTIGSSSANTRRTFNAFNYSDDLSWQIGRHELKIGGILLRYQENAYYAGTSTSGALGVFTFAGSSATGSTGSNWADFLEDQASTYAIGAQTGTWGQRQWRPALYVQDNWKASSDLTVNLGLRWEYDSPYTEVNNKQANVDPATGAATIAGADGAPRTLYDSYWKGFMPRVGFAYAPGSLHNRFAIRGGFGITNYFEGLGVGQRLTMNPLFVFNAIPSANTTAPYAVENGFGTYSPGIAQSTSFAAWDKHIKPALTQQYDLLLAYQFNNSTSIQVGYAGQTGHHLVNLLALNQSTCSTVPLPNLTQPCNVPMLSTFPKLAAGGFHYTESGAMMNYNALQATFKQHNFHGLEIIANYSYGKAMTDSPGFYGTSGVAGAYNAYPQDSYNLAGEYGAAYYDANHIVSGAIVYRLPIGRGNWIGRGWNHWLDTGLGGWKIGLTAQYRTGFPVPIVSTSYYSPSGHAGYARANKYRPLKIVHRGIRNHQNARDIMWFGDDPSAEGVATISGSSTYGSTGITGRTGSSSSVVTGTQTVPGTTCKIVSSSAVNPKAVFSQEYVSINGGAKSCVTVFTSNDNGTSAYGEELSTGFGTSSVSTERMPGYHDVSASASKEFSVRGDMAIDFRADAYNLFNSVSLGTPNNNISSTSFGQITSTSSTERRLQLALKLIF